MKTFDLIKVSNGFVVVPANLHCAPEWEKSKFFTAKQIDKIGEFMTKDAE